MFVQTHRMCSTNRGPQWTKCQYVYISDKYIILMGDTETRGSLCMCVSRGMWEISASFQFCYEPKTVLIGQCKKWWASWIYHFSLRKWLPWKPLTGGLCLGFKGWIWGMNTPGDREWPLLYHNFTNTIFILYRWHFLSKSWRTVRKKNEIASFPDGQLCCALSDTPKSAI